MTELLDAIKETLYRRETGRDTSLAAFTIPPGWAEVVGWFGDDDAPEAYTGPVVSESDTHIVLEIGWEPLVFLKKAWTVRR